MLLFFWGDFIGLGVVLLVCFTLLVWIRDIQKFGNFHIAADLIILVMVVSGIVFAIQKMAVETPKDYKFPALFNYQECFIFLGMAVYSFEGIGIIIPVHQQMKQKESFTKILILSLGTVVAVYITFALLNCFAYGQNVNALITQEFNQSNYYVQVIELFYMLTFFPTYVLMAYPAIKILEKGLFSKWGKTWKRKWSKNLLRASLVALTVATGVSLGHQFDKVMAIIGSLACVPLAFIFPGLFHYKLISKRTQNKKVIFVDWFLVVFGGLCFIFTTVVTILNWENTGSE
jgi:solute carrier family 36 (proton-coupled amino acid transporter)